MKFKNILWKNFLFQKKHWMGIYIISSMFICFFIILENLSFSTELVAKINNNSSYFMNTAMLFGAMMILVLSLLYIGYTCKLLLLSRMREYGIYLTLGVKKSRVAGMLLFENTILFLASWITGSLLGNIFVVLIILAIKKVYGIKEQIQLIQSSSIQISFIVYGIIFLVSTLISYLNYKRKEPLEIIKGSRKQRKLVVENAFLGIAGLFMFLWVGYTFIYNVLFNQLPGWMNKLMESKSGTQVLVISVLLILLFSLYLFVSQSLFLIIRMLFKIKPLYYYKLLPLREIRHHISDNSMIIFISIVVQMLTVIGIVVSYMQYTSIESWTRNFDPYDFACAYNNTIDDFDETYKLVLIQQNVNEKEHLQVEFITPPINTQLPDIIPSMSQIVISEEEVGKLLDNPIDIKKGTYGVIHTFGTASLRKMPMIIEMKTETITLNLRADYSLDSHVMNYMSRYHTGYLLILDDEDYSSISQNLPEESHGQLFLSYFENKNDSKLVADIIEDQLYEKYNINNFQLAYQYDRRNNNPYFIKDYYSGYIARRNDTASIIMVLYFLVFVFAVTFNGIIFFRMILGKDILLKNYAHLMRVGITRDEMKKYIRQTLRPIFILPSILATIFMILLIILLKDSSIGVLLMESAEYFIKRIIMIESCNLMLSYGYYTLVKKNYYKSL